MKVEAITNGLGEFFRSLLPNISKKDIMIDVTHSYDELNQIVIPMYDANTEDMTFKGELAKLMDKKLKEKKLDNSKNCYLSISKLLKKVSENEEEVMKLLQNEFMNEVIKDVIDYKRISILNYIESLNFINDYSRRFILGLVAQEFDSHTASKITGPIDKATISWVSDSRNMETFVHVLDICSGPTKGFLNSIKPLEGVTFDPTQTEIQLTIKAGELDPNGFGIIPVRLNPIYHIGLAVNKWRVARYERNVEEKAKLQLMLLALQEQKSKSQDKEKIENLEKQIKYRSNQINILTGKIEEMEEE